MRSLAGDSSRSSPYQSARLTSARIVRTCEDYARKWRYQDVTLAGLCEASGVSERRVRSAFYECYQMSPTAYLRVAALNAVRRELVEGPRLRNAVSRAATDWGFWHLSRFAAQYRALFGESPSHTLSHRTDRPQAAANSSFEPSIPSSIPNPPSHSETITSTRSGSSTSVTSPWITRTISATPTGWLVFSRASMGVAPRQSGLPTGRWSTCTADFRVFAPEAHVIVRCVCRMRIVRVDW